MDEAQFGAITKGDDRGRGEFLDRFSRSRWWRMYSARLHDEDVAQDAMESVISAVANEVRDHGLERPFDFSVVVLNNCSQWRRKPPPPSRSRVRVPWMRRWPESPLDVLVKRERAAYIWRVLAKFPPEAVEAAMRGVRLLKHMGGNPADEKYGRVQKTRYRCRLKYRCLANELFASPAEERDCLVDEQDLFD